MQQITINSPDDWHCHLRDQDFLQRTVADTASRFRRAIIMPNLKPPVTTGHCANSYLSRIKKHIPDNCDFSPLMTLYLTNQTTKDTIKDAKSSGILTACKLYPQGATTHSDAGVSHIKSLYPIFDVMQSLKIPLLIHGESTHPDDDVFDREQIFIDQTLAPIVEQFPDLKVVLEHITTKHAAAFVASARDGVGATITPHHLLFNRNAIFKGGIRPHYYCLPILKRESDREALIQAATSGNPKFFLGTDSAPHTQGAKENACGCAGIYSAHCAIELYTMIFEAVNALDKLNDFASAFGADFYGLPRNTSTMTLVKSNWQVPETLPFGDSVVIPLLAGETITWKIADDQ